MIRATGILKQAQSLGSRTKLLLSCRDDRKRGASVLPYGDRLELTFSRLEVNRWRQFGSIDIAFHPRLTVLTGANASGKTTLLSILAQHFNWNTQFLAVPSRSRGSTYQWQIDSHYTEALSAAVGKLTYSNGLTADIFAQGANSPTYGLGFGGQQLVPGIYISAQRSISGYQQLPSIPAQFSASNLLFDQFVSELMNRYRGQYSPRSPMFQLKEALMAAAIYGEGNSMVEPDPDAVAMWEGFSAVLARLLPKSLGYRELSVRPPEIVMHTETGEFLIDAVSGGLSAIIEIGWLIFLRSRQYETFTVCIDEPENHLHPSLQRSIVPGLIDAFPGITFVVATHSPFIVTAVPDSSVYVLDYDDDQVMSHLLDTASKAAGADETLRRVLGLETTSPLWVQTQLETILSRFPPEGASPEDLRSLRNDLVNIGLGELFPDAVNSLVSSPTDAASD